HEWARPDLRRRGRRTLWNAEFSRGDPCLTVIRAGWRDRTRRRPPLWAPRSRRSRSSQDPSALDLVPHTFQRSADLPPRLAEPFLDVARVFVGDAFVVEPLVVREVPGRLLDLSLRLVGLTLELVLVHLSPPARETFKFRCVS